MLIISFKKVSVRNNSELFSISYLHCYFNIRYRNVYLTALIFNLMPLSEIPYFKAIPVVSFILLYWHGIGREPHLKGTVKFIDCFHKPDGSDLEQILVLCTSSGEAADNAPHQSHILLNKLCSRSLISMVCSVDQAHHIIHRDYLLFCISKSFPHGHCSSQPRL